MTVIDEIAAERRRQIEAEGWTPEHDDQHDEAEMARAAALIVAEIERRDRRAASPTTTVDGVKEKLHVAQE